MERDLGTLGESIRAFCMLKAVNYYSRLFIAVAGCIFKRCL